MDTAVHPAPPAQRALPSADQAIGQIAVQWPGATAVFRRLRLDFCCGGQLSLSQAARDKGLDPQAVLAELAGLQRSDDLPDIHQPQAMVAHIITRYHDVHREQLPELIRMARRVEAVHRDHPLVPAGLADLLEDMQTELLAHMAKEEQILFPLLCQTPPHPFASRPIAVMRAEHTEHGAALDRVVLLTDDGRPPTGACNTWRALYAGLRQFSDDLMNHVHLENNVLFPQFEPEALAAH